MIIIFFLVLVVRVNVQEIKILFLLVHSSWIFVGVQKIKILLLLLLLLSSSLFDVLSPLCSLLSFYSFLLSFFSSSFFMLSSLRSSSCHGLDFFSSMHALLCKLLPLCPSLLNILSISFPTSNSLNSQRSTLFFSHLLLFLLFFLVTTLHRRGRSFKLFVRVHFVILVIVVVTAVFFVLLLMLSLPLLLHTTHALTIFLATMK